MYSQVQITEATQTSTKIATTLEIPGRVKAIAFPNGISLGGDRKILDYGHIETLLVEKYGQTRGEASYQGLIDKGNTMWTVAQKIQREKIHMMTVLGLRGSPDDHHYQGLRRRFETA